MKREDITKIFEGATDEQINAVININSAVKDSKPFLVFIGVLCW